VGEVEVLVGAVEDDDVDGVVALQFGQQRLEVGDHVRPDHVDRRVVEGHPPEGGRLLGERQVCGSELLDEGHGHTVTTLTTKKQV
jgi:hypothetical protein